LYPDEVILELHSRATEREKDKIWAQKGILQQIITTQDEFYVKLTCFFQKDSERPLQNAIFSDKAIGQSSFDRFLFGLSNCRIPD